MRNFGDVEVVPWIPGKSLGVALGDRGKVCASPRTSAPRGHSDHEINYLS